ncbi:Cytochrome b-c1 complex subunit Rieske, mitochondrial [Eumeta japonica]|uniref:Cytochrome b-c1 complex subunit Rieske, mitochondrial n=1 Tax=Eumeta variegata TaxID=151549 RepID=A0A4C1WWT5_EUMVA|nr:Cytochrome b-c1 complex subunit Rieske, mitochondrial [Eumeta japonica]
MTTVARAGHLAPYFKVTNPVVSSGLRPLTVVATSGDKLTTQSPPKTTTTHALNKALLSGNLKAVTGFSKPAQVRFAHTDLSIPDFTTYRRKEGQDPTVRASEVADSRQSISYLVVAGKLF